jgi:TrmH family RNA methyltransferase
MDAGAEFRTVLVCPEMLGPLADDLLEAVTRLPTAPRLLVVDAAVMRSVAETESPQGVVAVVAAPAATLPNLDPRGAFVLVLDGLRDPGNVGTLLRTGAAAGCTAAVTIAGSADAYAPKVVRAAMGAHFRVPVIADAPWQWLGPALAALPAVYGADGAADVTYDAVDWRPGVAVIVGNEDHGLSAEARAWCRGAVSIPMAGGVESLNAALSGAIILFEVVRQRRRAGGSP